ncbi:thiamine-repressible acid phosphatase pho4 [Schizosaccharomyces japonicus yFS275]|uniref:Thiamine-repressible acid phosphatase pho4 n=1 Tax=Schizosaccharomyces japonicus (strain yFS275 / FY16936) TaxID=402676 RepID=B6JZD6_SCHJY|nr:thiamine-repressible acid phosphatase pho4 [Schizosaccharomyces japonicus yFS275]EEB06904.1 thiamine-repressible acid phosphatase pho4 [Schizosaccharomyces japonicus yFS275]
MSSFVRSLLVACLVALASASTLPFGSYDNTDIKTYHLGSLSDYHSPENFLDNDFPESCELKQVHILQRHGSRNPTAGTKAGSAGGIQAFENRLTNGTISFNSSISDNAFNFVSSWEPIILEKNADLLSDRGRYQMFDLGVQNYLRYTDLINDKDFKFQVNTAAQDRVVESAEWYMSGMLGRSYVNETTFQYVPEDSSASINTLSGNDDCKNYENYNSTSSAVVKAYLKKALEAPRKRLSEYLVDGQEFTTDDVVNMFSLCAYENALQGESDFCDLFTPTEFRAWEYSYDLKFSYENGPSNPWTQPVGAAFANNMANQILKLVNGTTSEDDQQIFLAFTHDSHITTVETSLGFFPDTTPSKPLAPSFNYYNQSLKTSQYVPFGGNLITEVFKCDDDKFYVRHLVNQRTFPLTDCGNGPSGVSDGLCEVNAYLNSDARRDAVFHGIETYKETCGTDEPAFEAMY